MTSRPTESGAHLTPARIKDPRTRRAEPLPEPASVPDDGRGERGDGRDR